jgi:hypothetical protein
MADAGNKPAHAREAERALIAASEQIGLALSESGPQVEALGEALQKLASGLAAGGPGVPVALRGDLQRAVARLQFYDRMTQHLTHVQDYLARSARQLASQTRENPARQAPDASWTGVHQTLSERLLTETQRFHLDKSFRDSLAAGGEVRRKAAGASAPGDIDLF